MSRLARHPLSLVTFLVVIGALTVVFLLPQTTPRVEAQLGTPNADVPVQVSGIQTAKGVLRTSQEVLAAEAQRAPAAAAVRIPFRPTLDAAAYAAAKSAVAAAPAAAKPAAPALQAPPALVFANVEGISNAEVIPVQGVLEPPDTHGAVGSTQFVEVVNTALRVYNKTSPGTTLQLNASLASFFGYSAQTIFDPRVQYDAVWNRWVVYAEAFQESTTVQRIFIAASTTSNAAGPYCVYNINIAAGQVANDFWDYGQLGMDQDAIHLTANIFNGNTFKGASLVTFAKARLYNCMSVSFPRFNGLVGTLSATNVIGQNATTFLVAAPAPATTGTTVTKYTLRNSAYPNGISLSASAITVPAYAVPPAAIQPGTAIKLDTLDARFVNASTQIGASLFQVHTIALGSFPAPHFYEFNTTTNTVTQQATFFASASSHDWNASIAANVTKDVFVTWTSTDPGVAALNAQVRFGGRRAADALGTMGVSAALFTSPTFYTGFGGAVERWGDYSAVTIDPLNSLRAWLVNQKNNTPTAATGGAAWGSRVGNVGF
jgi:hypothetical protein